MPDEVWEYMASDFRLFLHTEFLQILQMLVLTLLQFIPLIYHRIQVRELGWLWQNLDFVFSDQFLCWFWFLFWISVVMEDLTMTHYNISNWASQFYLFFYLLVFDIKHDGMYLNKMSRTFGVKLGPQKRTSGDIFKCGHGALFLSLCAPNL